MNTQPLYVLVAEFTLSLTETSELIASDNDQAARVLEAAISQSILQLIGEGNVTVMRFELYPFT